MSPQKVTWHDAGREPRVPFNRKHPDGVDIDLSNGAASSCRTELPWPAPRCGFYQVACACGQVVALTAAGRVDDPRSVKVACRLRESH